MVSLWKGPRTRAQFFDTLWDTVLVRILLEGSSWYVPRWFRACLVLESYCSEAPVVGVELFGFYAAVVFLIVVK